MREVVQNPNPARLGLGPSTDEMGIPSGTQMAASAGVVPKTNASPARLGLGTKDILAMKAKHATAAAAAIVVCWPSSLSAFAHLPLRVLFRFSFFWVCHVHNSP